MDCVPFFEALSPAEEPKLQRLDFTTDARIAEASALALKEMAMRRESLDLAVDHFAEFGNDFFRSRGVYGDTIVQLALQTAYQRVHAKPAPAYETASTRKYWHGRTETVRSATSETVAFARALLGEEADEQELFSLLKTAMRKHNLLMAEAMDAQGIDRHLLGIKTMCRDMGLPEPAIFTDPAWVKSGGGGNYILSTSFIGYTDIWGGVAPMCENGYGVFYKIKPGVITIFTSAWRGTETSRREMAESIFWALRRLHTLVSLLPEKGKKKPKL